MRGNVADNAIVVTDEYTGYRGLGKTHFYKTVNQSQGEYAHTGNYHHINSIEGAWWHIKRQIYGIHHWISGKHLGRYLAEMTWRYNHREMEEGVSLNALLGRVEGRLMYKELIA